MTDHSHTTGKLSHLELVLMLTKAAEELGIDRAAFEGADDKLFRHAMQQAYDHGVGWRLKEKPEEPDTMKGDALCKCGHRANLHRSWNDKDRAGCCLKWEGCSCAGFVLEGM